MVRRAQLSPEDHARVTEAVREAERGTDGEIVTVVARSSDSYADVAWAIAGLVAVLSLYLFVLLAPQWMLLADRLGNNWSAESHSLSSLWLLPSLVTITFVFMRLILEIRPLRLLLTPAAIKHARVHARARALFLAAAEQRTAAATGILLYLSLDERRAEIIGDAPIATRVPAETWGETLAELIARARRGAIADGMVEAVRQIGLLLSAHFPKSADNPNELPDRLIEL